jgi:hypothetical protein
MVSLETVSLQELIGSLEFVNNLKNSSNIVFSILGNVRVSPKP